MSRVGVRGEDDSWSDDGGDVVRLVAALEKDRLPVLPNMYLSAQALSSGDKKYGLLMFVPFGDGGSH